MVRKRGDGSGGAPRTGMPRLRDVALKARVSAATASRVLNGQSELVSPATYRRVLKVIEELGYFPAALGRALRQGQSNMVALLIPDTQNPFYSAIANSIEQCLQQSGINLILSHAAEDPSKQDVALRQVRGLRTRCIVMLGAVDSPGLHDAVRHGVPVVFINRRPPAGVQAPFIGIDNRAAGRDVARLLYAQGARRFGVVRGPVYSSASLDRFTGFAEALAELGCRLRSNLIWDGALSIQSGWELGAKIVPKAGKLDAIFCANDLIAYGLHRRLVEHGLRIPRDLALVGFDDTPLNRWLAPWLTSVHVAYEAFGPAVQELLREPLPLQPREILLQHHLVERSVTSSEGDLS